MTRSRTRAAALLVVAAFAGVALSGCIDVDASSDAPAPQTREIRMWVEAMDWEIAPGVTTPVWAFCGEGNGVEPVHAGQPCGVPGPTIRVNKGDTVRLTFENTHTIPHTVHFHGWHTFVADLNGNGALHGDMVVAGGETKTFEWLAQPAGTFIYHCHFETAEHMEMGMSGAFIVDDPAAQPDAEKPDKEFVTVIDEWAIHDGPTPRHGNMPAYNYFTMNGKSFPLTQPWFVEPGERVRLHFVNGGYEFHALHVHGYTPMSWEGVAGPKHAVPTDVREIAPGQSVVLELIADREGVWLTHDHVVPRVTAGSDGTSFGAYPRGMLAALVVGKAHQEKFLELAPVLLAAAQNDATDADSHASHGHDAPATAAVVQMRNYAYAQTELRIKAGETVTWMNRDSVMHTVTADDGSFDSGDIAAGASWSMTFGTPGTYTYHCAPHAAQDKAGVWKGMVATVIVE